MMKAVRFIALTAMFAVFSNVSSGQSVDVGKPGCRCQSDGLVPTKVVPAERLISNGRKISNVPLPSKTTKRQRAQQPKTTPSNAVPQASVAVPFNRGLINDDVPAPQPTPVPQNVLHLDNQMTVTEPAAPSVSGCENCSSKTRNCSDSVGNKCPMCGGSGNSSGNDADGWKCTTTVRRGYWGGRIPALITFSRPCGKGQTSCGCGDSGCSDGGLDSNDNGPCGTSFNFGCSDGDCSAGNCGGSGADCGGRMSGWLDSIAGCGNCSSDNIEADRFTWPPGLLINWFRDRHLNEDDGCSNGSHGCSGGNGIDWGAGGCSFGQGSGGGSGCANSGSGCSSCLGCSSQSQTTAGKPDEPNGQPSLRLSWRPPWLK